MATPPERREPGAGRILVVDDQVSILSLLTDCLEESGYTVATAQESNAALAAIARARPDVVLLDLFLGQADGVELLGRIQAIDATIPVIMMSGDRETGLARTAVSLGAFDHLAKPFDLADLNRAVVAARLYGDRMQAAEQRALTPATDRAEALARLRQLARRTRLEAELLFIVSPERPNLHDAIRRAFGGMERVEVIFDRRAAARARGAAAPPPAAERRRTSVDAELAALGWALVTRR